MHPHHPGARHVFGSLDEMLSPTALAEILGRPIDSVSREAFTTAGFSSTEASFEAVHVDGEDGLRLIAKSVARARDWVALATRDEVDREVWSWESGLLDRLSAPATHAVLSAARTSDTYSLLMTDLSAHLLPEEWEISASPAHQYLVIEALAELHAEFWMDETLDDASLGLSTLGLQIGHGAPSTLDRLRDQMVTSGIIEWIAEGWRKLPEVMDPHMAADLRAIADDPRPVVDAAARYPWTLAHTDPRPANLAVDLSGGTVYFLDWARPAPAPPAYDLCYWLFNGNRHHSLPPDRIIDAYAMALRHRLGSRFSGDWWPGQLEVGFVAFLASFAPLIAQAKPDALPWWSERARPGLLALS